jgi:hypothetical protein
MLWKLDGYLVIPHELMHVLAYRLIGKRCAYRLGGHAVTVLDDRTFGQRLFCLLFPLLVNSLVVLLLLGVWFITYLVARYPINPLDYFRTAPVWHRLLFFGWTLALIYAGACLWDVIFAGRLLAEKLSQQPPHETHKPQYDETMPKQGQDTQKMRATLGRLYPAMMRTENDPLIQSDGSRQHPLRSPPFWHGLQRLLALAFAFTFLTIARQRQLRVMSPLLSPKDRALFPVLLQR